MPSSSRSSSARSMLSRARSSASVCHPGGDDRKSRPTGLEPDLVEPGSAHVLRRSLQPDLELVPFGGDRGRGQEHRRSMLTRLRFGDPLEEPVEGDGRRRIGDVGDHLHPGPQPRGPGESDGVQSELEQLPNGSRGEQRHHQAATDRLAGARQRRRLALGVVADQRHRAAERSGAADVAVADRIRGSVEPGVLAVPEPDDPVVATPVELPDQLRSRHRRRRKLLVDTRRADDRLRLEIPPRALQLAIEPAERRARIAAHVDRGVKSSSPIETPLVERQPNEGLDPRHQCPAGRRAVLVVERNHAALGLLDRRRLRRALDGRSLWEGVGDDHGLTLARAYAGERAAG